MKSIVVEIETKRYDVGIVWVRKETPCYIQCFCDNELIKRCENLGIKLEDIYKR